MREIEVKAKLRDESAFLKKATAMGIEFGAIIEQDDTTYETAIPKDDPNWNIFRIRKQNGKHILTMKYKASTRKRDNHERESEISHPEEVADMLARVGYAYGVHIHKRRRKAAYKDLELCLDEIDKLGTFIEIEKLAEHDADVDAIQTELWQLLLDLGIKPEDKVMKGYDTMMHAYLQNDIEEI